MSGSSYKDLPVELQDKIIEGSVDVFSTSDLIANLQLTSKDMNQINDSGVRAAGRYPNMEYWTYNWRKNGGSARMYTIAKRENFYQQEYCGCVYSLRDTNAWRKQNTRERIKIGVSYYSDEPKLETQE